MIRSSVFTLLLVAALVVPSATAAQSARSAAEQARALHVLNRLAFGPRPGDVDRVLKLGIDRWIEQQLTPETIEDRMGAIALAGCPIWTVPIDSALSMMVRTGGFYLFRSDSVKKLSKNPQMIGNLGANNQLIACRLARMEASEQQLLEVMTNFWENHFSVYGRTMLTRGQVVQWDRAVLRPHAFGRFRDLLGAVAHSPSMLGYLDNDVSGANAGQPRLSPGVSRVAVDGLEPPTGINENYARELMELHTLGVDGGYTQADVIEVARAFTGWSSTTAAMKLLRPASNGVIRVPAMISQILRNGNSSFVFDSTWHDAGQKVVLGHTLAAGRGLQDGEDVLDILARHPSTARFIARKLAVRFVNDNPPDALVERAAATFTRTDGDIRDVVRTIVTSPEFMAAAVHSAKVKSPLELVLSTRRALNAPVDTVAEIVDFLIDLKQPPFGNIAPDGWPETGAEWLSAGGLIARMAMATRIAGGEHKSVPLEAWPEWKSLVNQSFEKQVDGVIRTLLHNRATPALRAALIASKPEVANPNTAEAREAALRRLVALTLGSAEFQRR